MGSPGIGLPINDRNETLIACVVVRWHRRHAQIARHVISSHHFGIAEIDYRSS
jgi:hypothetical protein